MRKITLGLICVLACWTLVMPLAAQEGFPLKGTWLGDWGEGTTNRNQVFVVFDWDGKVISGSVNPGTDMITIKNASLTPTPVGGAAAPGGAAPGAGGGGGGRGGGRGGGGGAGAAPGAPGAAAPAGAAPAAPAGQAAAGAGGGGRGGGGGGRGGGGGGGAAAGAAAPAPGAPALPAAGAGQGAGGGGGGRGGGNTLGAQSGGITAPATTDWVVHFEGDGKDSKGATIHYVVDGKIENIGLYNRSMSGTWVSGAAKGTFKLQRQ